MTLLFVGKMPVALFEKTSEGECLMNAWAMNHKVTIRTHLPVVTCNNDPRNMMKSRVTYYLRGEIDSFGRRAKCNVRRRIIDGRKVKTRDCTARKG